MKYDPVLFLYGSEHFLRRRFYRQTLFQAEVDGWQVDYATGAETHKVQEVLDTTGVLFDANTFLVVEKPDKLDESLIVDHSKVVDPSVVLLLYYEGMPKGKFANLVKKFPNQRKFFEAAPPFKADEVAITFCMEEAQRKYGIKLPINLAKSLVVRVGTNLGVLFFEVQKVCLLTKSENKEEVVPENIRGVYSDVMEVSVFSLADHLGKRNLKWVAFTLNRIKKTHAQDPTMAVCGVLSQTVLLWLCAANLLAKGVAGDPAAKQLGVSPYRYQQHIIPYAKLWGQDKLRELVQVFAQAHRDVMSGVVSPWNNLSGRILSLVQ